MDIENKAVTNYSKEFSDRLRYLRNKKNISAREMSIALGQNVNYINLIENEKRFPSLQGFFSICDYLEISVADFFNSENFSSRPAEDGPAKKEDLLLFIDSLSQEQVSLLTRFVKTFDHSAR